MRGFIMSEPVSILDPDLLEKARHLYEETKTPVMQITRMLEINRFQFQSLSKQSGWKTRRPAYTKTRFAERRLLVRRIENAVGCKIAAIERCMDSPDTDPEKSARALATLAKILRELSEMDVADSKTRREDAAHKDEPPPRDIETLRATLAKKLEQLKGQGEG
jgi:DNA-binding transcriptional MerR regulator